MIVWIENCLFRDSAIELSLEFFCGFNRALFEIRSQSFLNLHPKEHNILLIKFCFSSEIYFQLRKFLISNIILASGLITALLNLDNEPWYHWTRKLIFSFTQMQTVEKCMYSYYNPYFYSTVGVRWKHISNNFFCHIVIKLQLGFPGETSREKEI